MSSLRFRNLDVDPSAPVAQWGVEGLLAAIDRGSLPDWRRIVSAINADPWGPLASDLSAAIELAEDRGVAVSLSRAINRARAAGREPRTERGQPALGRPGRRIRPHGS